MIKFWNLFEIFKHEPYSTTTTKDKLFMDLTDYDDG